MAAIAFRHLLSRWTVTGATSKAAAILPQGRGSWARSSRRSYFGFHDTALAEAKRRLDHTSYMKLAEQEQLRLNRTIRRLTSGYFVTGIGLFFANIYASLPPSTRTNTSTTTSNGVTSTATSNGV